VISRLPIKNITSAKPSDPTGSSNPDSESKHQRRAKGVFIAGGTAGGIGAIFVTSYIFFRYWVSRRGRNPGAAAGWMAATPFVAPSSKAVVNYGQAVALQSNAAGRPPTVPNGKTVNPPLALEKATASSTPGANVPRAEEEEGADSARDAEYWRREAELLRQELEQREVVYDPSEVLPGYSSEVLSQLNGSL